MTREHLVTIWRDATGLPFHPGSATERGLRAVLEALANDMFADRYLGAAPLWEIYGDIRKILDDSVNNK